MQAAAAMEVFGRQGTQLLPLFAGGAAGMEQLRDEARRLGITMSTEDAQAAADYTDAMTRLRRALETAWQAIGAAVAPVLTDLSNRFAQAAGQIRQYIDEHRDARSVRRPGCLPRCPGSLWALPLLLRHVARIYRPRRGVPCTVQLCPPMVALQRRQHRRTCPRSLLRDAHDDPSPDHDP